MKLALSAAVLSAFFLMPVFADVIPSRPGGRRSDRDLVAAEIARRGVNANESSGQARAMSARDIDYFSSDPRRVQLAAGVPIDDIIIGAVFLAIATTVAIVVAVQGSRGQ